MILYDTHAKMLSTNKQNKQTPRILSAQEPALRRGHAAQEPRPCTLLTVLKFIKNASKIHQTGPKHVSIKSRSAALCFILLVAAVPERARTTA